MNGDLPEPKKGLSDLAAMLVVIVVVLLVCGFIYVAVEIADTGIKILNQGARQLKDYTEKRSRELEQLQKEIDRLDRY